MDYNYQRRLLQKISETQVSSYNWGIKNWNTLKANYARARYFKLVSPILEEFYRTIKTPFLSQLNVSLIKIICHHLNIKTKITNSTDYNLTGDPTEKLINLRKQSKSSSYLSGPSAKNYLREELFSDYR